MSIQRFAGFYSLSCDVCQEEAEEQFFEFHEAVDHKKNNGWQSRKRNGHWEDVCPDCQDAEMGLSDD